MSDSLYSVSCYSSVVGDRCEGFADRRWEAAPFPPRPHTQDHPGNSCTWAAGGVGGAGGAPVPSHFSDRSSLLPASDSPQCLPLPLLRTLWSHWAHQDKPGLSSYREGPLIPSAKSLLLWKVKYSQVPGIRVWTCLGCHYSANHMSQIQINRLPSFFPKVLTLIHGTEVSGIMWENTRLGFSPVVWVLRADGQDGLR